MIKEGLFLLALPLADSIGLHKATAPGVQYLRYWLNSGPFHPLFTFATGIPFYSKGNEQKSGPSGATELGDIVQGNSGSNPSGGIHQLDRW